MTHHLAYFKMLSNSGTSNDFKAFSFLAIRVKETVERFVKLH